MKPIDIAILAGCVLIGLGRFLIPGHDLSLPGTYEAFAHLWIGGIIGAWAVQRRPLYLWAVGILTVLETVMFLLRKGA